jgi:DNA-directed RNA polymerase subunit RPC12/RpoP
MGMSQLTSKPTSEGSSGLTFPCKNCGAELAYDAGSQGMACPYCGHKEAVGSPAEPNLAGSTAGNPGWAMPPAGAAAIREIPIEQGMAMALKGFGAPVTTLRCNDCGATVNVGEGERTASCAFCGSKQVLSEATNQSAIRPESLVPFKVTREDANSRFGVWIGKLWFRPGDLKKMAKVQEIGGVYIPFWTFDAFVSSVWSAERGFYYYETETYTETVDGRTETRTRQVQRTRWEPASGSRQDAYDDVLVCASKGLPPHLVDNLSTFDTKALTPYQPQFLAGWRAESYAIDLMPGWQLGQERIGNSQMARCAGDVGGDTHRCLSVSNQFSNITFKHVLLPIWIAAYRYNGKVYRFLVNGQTGEVVGVAPWSVWKILGLVIVVLAIVGAIVAYKQFSDAGNTRATPASPVPASHAPAPAHGGRH